MTMNEWRNGQETYGTHYNAERGRDRIRLWGTHVVVDTLRFCGIATNQRRRRRKGRRRKKRNNNITIHRYIFQCAFHSTAQKRYMFELRPSIFRPADVYVSYTVSFVSLNEIYRVCFAYARSAVVVCLCKLLLFFLRSFAVWLFHFWFLFHFPHRSFIRSTIFIHIFLLAYGTPFVRRSLCVFFLIRSLVRCDEPEFEFMHCRLLFLRPFDTIKTFRARNFLHTFPWFLEWWNFYLLTSESWYGIGSECHHRQHLVEKGQINDQ